MRRLLPTDPRPVRIRASALVVFTLSSLLAGCLDTLPDVSFTTAQEARNAGYVDKDWIPSWLPDNATDIHEAHDVDSNISMLAFSLPDTRTLVLPDTCRPVEFAQTYPAPLRRPWWPDDESLRSSYAFFRCTADATQYRFVGVSLQQTVCCIGEPTATSLHTLHSGQEDSMGTWGIGSFENDDAADFMIDLLDSGDLSLVREVLDNVLTSTEYVEAPDATLAIVAAEIVAAARGRPTPAATQEEGLADWLARIRPTIDADLAAQARDALTRILADNSELRELWEETDDLHDWQAVVAELRGHLVP
jgi:hypothetical protein